MKPGTHVRIARSLGGISVAMMIGQEGTIVEVDLAHYDCRVWIPALAGTTCFFFAELEPVIDPHAEAFAAFLAKITKPEPIVEMVRLLDARGGSL